MAVRQESGVTSRRVRCYASRNVRAPSVGKTFRCGWTTDILWACSFELTVLRAAPGVEDMRLDFPLDLRIDRETVMAQFDYFPPELVSLAGALGLGLELSIYPVD